MTFYYFYFIVKQRLLLSDCHEIHHMFLICLPTVLLINITNHRFETLNVSCFLSIYSKINITRGQSNLTKSASRGAHSPVRGHPRGSKVVPLNSWGRVSY